jgi:hypothetical protein
VLAVLPSLPAPAAVAVDPVYAAIEAHRAANAVHLAAIDEVSRLEKIDWRTDWGYITEKPCHAANDALEILLGAMATTLSGLFAKLAYLRAIAVGKEAWMVDEREGTVLALIESFTASLKSIGGLA